MTRAHYDAQTRALWRELARRMQRYPNVSLVDSSGFFCDASICPVSRDGYALFVDQDHISTTAANNFARSYLADPSRYTVNPADDSRAAPLETR